MKTLLLLVITLTSAFAGQCDTTVRRTQDVFRKQASDYLQNHLLSISASSKEVNLRSDGNLFAADYKRKALKGFKDSFSLRRGDAFYANFKPGEHSYTTFALRTITPEFIEFRYSVIGFKNNVMCLDEGFISLAKK